MGTHGRRSPRGHISLLVGLFLIASSLVAPAAQAVEPDGDPTTLVATLTSSAGGPGSGTFNLNLDMTTRKACYVSDISGLDLVAAPVHDVLIYRVDVGTTIIFAPPFFDADGHGEACGINSVPNAVMQDIFNHASDYAALVYVETVGTHDSHVAVGGRLGYQYDTVSVDVTTKLCPATIQSPAALVGQEDSCTTAALPGFDYRVTDSQNLDATIADAVPSGAAYRYANVAEGAVTVKSLSVPDGYRVGTATATESLGGGDGGPWTFTANGNEDVTVFLFREPDAPPIVTAPVVRFRTGVQYGPAAVRLSWTGADVASIDHFTLQRSRNGGAYVTIYTGTAASFDTTLSTGHTYRFRVMATDDADQTSGWKYSPTSTFRAIQNTSSRVKYGGRWAKVTSTFSSGGSTHKASTAGKTATLAFRGRAVAWVAPQSLTRGKARVYLDGVLKTTIDLGRTSKARVVQYTATWSKVGNHTISIRVVGTSGRPRVDHDAFLYLD